jgi:lipopolysaccharide/colanic/teichoic acid biosynthesis glycosyltransferase
MTFWKRCFDLIIAIAGLLLLSPILLLIAAAVRLVLGKPVLFRQQRPGLGGRPFTIYKFRTMRNAEFGRVNDADRMAGFGSFLRKTSLDELPELWNVACREMSLVGPRPLLMQYLDRYSEEHKRRHDVLPGVTGWAQVHGRNAVTWEQRFAMDLWYVDHQSFWLDLKILWLSIRQTITGAGIAQPGFATMPEFMGSAGEKVSDSTSDAMPRASLLDG